MLVPANLIRPALPVRGSRSLCTPQWVQRPHLSWAASSLSIGPCWAPPTFTTTPLPPPTPPGGSCFSWCSFPPHTLSVPTLSSSLIPVPSATSFPTLSSLGPAQPHSQFLPEAHSSPLCSSEVGHWVLKASLVKDSSGKGSYEEDFCYPGRGSWCLREFNAPRYLQTPPCPHENHLLEGSGATTVASPPKRSPVQLVLISRALRASESSSFEDCHFRAFGVLPYFSLGDASIWLPCF